jgi:hypothetical protein
MAPQRRRRLFPSRGNGQQQSPLHAGSRALPVDDGEGPPRPRLESATPPGAARQSFRRNRNILLARSNRVSRGWRGARKACLLHGTPASAITAPAPPFRSVSLRPGCNFCACDAHKSLREVAIRRPAPPAQSDLKDYSAWRNGLPKENRYGRSVWTGWVPCWTGRTDSEIKTHPQRVGFCVALVPAGLSATSLRPAPRRAKHGASDRNSCRTIRNVKRYVSPGGLLGLSLPSPFGSATFAALSPLIKNAPGVFVEPPYNGGSNTLEEAINKKARPKKSGRAFLFIWRPLGDSNPRYRRERAVSWASRRRGRVAEELVELGGIEPPTSTMPL